VFSIEETRIWTAEQVFDRLRAMLPAGWTIAQAVESGWHSVILQDAEGVQQWAGEHVDPKFVGLDALGWLRVRGQAVKNPAWRPRDQEVSLHRPPMPVVSAVPDPEDLDPKEVEAVYRTSR
jgi:hypothetical protein